MLFIDSSAAEGSVLKGYSANVFLAAKVGCFWTLAAMYGLRVWIGRVPSSLNPSDGFSRGDESLGVELGWNSVEAQVPDPRPCAFLHTAHQQNIAKLAKMRRRHQGQ